MNLIITKDVTALQVNSIGTVTIKSFPILPTMAPAPAEVAVRDISVFLDKAITANIHALAIEALPLTVVVAYVIKRQRLAPLA